MDNTGLKKYQSERLIFLGMFLFFLGLMVGLFIPLMANPRMGLTTHLEGVINGIFLLVLGLIWNKTALSDKWLKIAYWLTIYGAFANFAAVLIAAVTGAGKMMPIAGGVQGEAATESIISFLLVSLALAMLAACLIILVGLYKYIRVDSHLTH
jgi:hydroxylaminobenzene mutase